MVKTFLWVLPLKYPNRAGSKVYLANVFLNSGCLLMSDTYRIWHFAYLPLLAWPHIHWISGSRPLQPLTCMLAPPWPSSVSRLKSARQTTLSSLISSCGAAVPSEEHMPDKEHDSKITELWVFIFKKMTREQKLLGQVSVPLLWPQCA